MYFIFTYFDFYTIHIACQQSENNSGDSFSYKNLRNIHVPCATANVEHLVLTARLLESYIPLPSEKDDAKSPGSQLCSDRTQLSKTQASSPLLS